MREKDKIWLAATIDCDGTIFYENKEIDINGWRRRRAYLQCCNTCLELINRANKLLDGGLIVKRDPSIEKDGIKHNKIIYHAKQMNHDKVLKLLKEINPYLIAKKKKALEVIKFIETTDWGKKSEKAKLEISSRMKRIWRKRKEASK